LRLWGESYVEGDYTNIDFSNSGTGGVIGRIGVSNTGAGSGLSFGTSNNYGTGITNEAMVIDPAGNVGIGAATPSTDLHVDGNVRVTGSYRDSNNSAGTSGQVLSSSGGGTDWVDAPSGGTPVVEAWQTPTFTNSWANFGGGYNPAGYFKDNSGVVHLRGLVRSSVLGAAIFTLPNTHRPPGRAIFSVMSNNLAARVDVLNNGQVVPVSGSSAWISLEGITFRVAP
jgi:hypothetical protein